MPKYREATAEKVLRLICSTFARWKTCRIHASLVEHLLELTGGVEPALLEAVQVCDSAQFDGHNSAGAFARAPRLRSWHGFLDNEHATTWRQLTRMSVSNWVTLRSLMPVLQACHELVELRVCIKNPGHSTADAQDRVDLPCIEELILGLDHVHTLTELLTSLTVPRLLRLQIQGNNETDDGQLNVERWPVEELDGMLGRSHCKIENLALRCISMPSGEMLAMAKQFSSLLELDIRHDYALPIILTDDLLRSMTAVREGPPPLLPQLKNLSIMGPLQLDHAVLLMMVELRTTKRFTRLHISAMRGSKSDDMDKYTEDRIGAMVDSSFSFVFDDVLARDTFQGIDFALLGAGLSTVW